MKSLSEKSKTKLEYQKNLEETRAKIDFQTARVRIALGKIRRLRQHVRYLEDRLLVFPPEPHRPKRDSAVNGSAEPWPTDAKAYLDFAGWNRKPFLNHERTQKPPVVKVDFNGEPIGETKK